MKKRLKLFQVDAFTDRIFGGNPAAVCVLEEWPTTETLQKIAAENFLPETAFFSPAENPGVFNIKWFTPDIEMDLCGHATLATAHIILRHLDFPGDNITFQSNSGELRVFVDGEKLVLDFPAREPVPSSLPPLISQAFQEKIVEVWKSRDYVIVLEDEQAVRNCKPNRSILDQINLDPGGIIITAKGNEVDFVSRFFTPQSTIFEDPVTGSAHCSLIPLWSKKLNKKKMTAHQVSQRLGELYCEYSGERVFIGGKACTYSEGYIYL